MGKNTPERQEYIIRNLRFEHDLVEDHKENESEGAVSGPKEESDPVNSEAA